MCSVIGHDNICALMARKAWDKVKTAVYSIGKPVPTPPAKFRALVHGASIDPEGHARIGREMFKLVRQHCQLQPSSIVLDIGCGCGRVAAPLTSYITFGTYHGVDIVQPMVIGANTTFPDGPRTLFSSRRPEQHPL